MSAPIGYRVASAMRHRADAIARTTGDVELERFLLGAAEEVQQLQSELLDARRAIAHANAEAEARVRRLVAALKPLAGMTECLPNARQVRAATDAVAREEGRLGEPEQQQPSASRAPDPFEAPA